MLEKIVSGGQTGADRAALDWAISRGVRHGGWCPKGRKAEDGVIPDGYKLRETTSANSLQRTEKNVIDSDGTVIFTFDRELSGGSKRTADFAARHGKPLLQLRPTTRNGPEVLAVFIRDGGIKVLNVAGPPASDGPNIALFTKQTLDTAGRALGLPIDLKLVALSVSLIASAIDQLAPPKEPIQTLPWMVRRFSQKLIQCKSEPDVAALVRGRIRDACAFVTFATEWLKLIEAGQAELRILPQDAAIEVTAAGHAMIDAMNQGEEIYPEGSTDIPEDE